VIENSPELLDLMVIKVEIINSALDCQNIAILVGYFQRFRSHFVS